MMAPGGETGRNPNDRIMIKSEVKAPYLHGSTGRK